MASDLPVRSFLRPVWCWRAGVGELGEAGDQQPLGESGEESGLPHASGGDLVAEGARDAVDEAVGAEPPHVVGDLPAGHGIGGRYPAVT
jgi:hypothetical protein